MPNNIKMSQAVATLAILLLESCALINPHVTWQRPDPPLTLDQAIKYANDGREAYKQGVATYTAVPNVLAMTLIPLGAGAIGSGFGGVHPTTIGYMALAGAGVFTLGQWFNNPLRQDVYIAGMNGITCSVEAVLPLKIDKAALTEGLNQIRIHGAKAEGHAREVARLVAEIDAIVQTPQSKAAAQSFASAKEVIDRVYQTSADGHALLDLHERAGELLSIKVGQIDTLVTKQLKSTQPDVDSLRLLVQGLGQTARTLIPVSGKSAELLGVTSTKKEFEAQGTTDEDEKRRTELSRQLDNNTRDMNTAVSQLSVEGNHVQAIVDSAVRSKPSETLKRCGVEEVELAFTLDPPAGLTLPRGKFASVTVTGGKAPYSGRFDLQPTEGLTILPRDATDRTFNIAASGDAPTQEYTLRIEDALRNVQRTKIQVVEALTTPKSAPPGADSGTGVKPKTLAPVLDETKLKEFASAIQAQTIKDGGLEIVVGDSKIDSAGKVVTVKIVTASNPLGTKVTDDQIRDALLAKGAGPAKGVKREHIKINR